MKHIKLKKIGFLITICTLFSGCSALTRSYIEEMERESDGFYQPGKDFPIVSGDSGEAFRSREEIQKRTPASDRKVKQTKETQSLKDELKLKVGELNEQEMASYSKDLKYLESDSDKLYYLSLAQSERSSYIKTRKTENDYQKMDIREYTKKASIHSDEIFLGMSKDEVIQLWGKPTRVQIAGNPRYQNELWLFNEDGSVKQVFFEGGRVNGWALDL